MSACPKHKRNPAAAAFTFAFPMLFVVLFNASGGEVGFRLPARRFGMVWELELSTADPALEPGSRSFRTREEVRLTGRSLVVLRRIS